MDYSKLYGKLLETELIQHYNKLEDICKNIGEKVEGSCFTFDKHVHIRPSELLSKQVNLFLISSKSNNIMEIGFNAGHSCLIYLFSNKKSKITLFDICEHKYTQPCFDYLDSLFPGRLTLIKGDSTQTIPKFRRDNQDTKFDFIHIDGCHDEVIAKQDIYNCISLTSKHLIIDDTQLKHIRKLVKKIIDDNIFFEIKLYKTTMYEHIILSKIKNID